MSSAEKLKDEIVELLRGEVKDLWDEEDTAFLLQPR